MKKETVLRWPYVDDGDPQMAPLQRISGGGGGRLRRRWQRQQRQQQRQQLHPDATDRASLRPTDDDSSCKANETTTRLHCRGDAASSSFRRWPVV